MATTWATMEFVVWNTLPPLLVGKWVVVGGEQDGATFDFYRNGTMTARINADGKEGIINARVAVEGKTLRITTQDPNTQRDDVRKHAIKTLDESNLTLQDERGMVVRMERAKE
jgi:uncharacterized protein (TIGR03066 family)